MSIPSAKNSLDKILVANRGEIARRVIRSAKRMGLQTVAVYSEADITALHVQEADESVLLGPAPAAQSYLNIPALLRAIKQTGAQMVHPGYGFLSENAEFVATLAENNVIFVGPSLLAINVMGDKITARNAAEQAGVNIIPGISTAAEDADQAKKMAEQIGYPVMLKAAAGGGGKGMRMVENPAQLTDSFNMASSEALRSFGDARMFVERFIEQPRHIEVQLLADTHGNVVVLAERECSLQRRHQKVIEEAPSSILRQEVREELLAQARLLAKSVGYCSAGTVEFIVDKQQNFFFLEMNTRLQVEHPVTEMIHGNIDLVEWMIRIAWGEALSADLMALKPEGHAIEARLYAENPENGFIPSSGRLRVYQPPQLGAHLRLDDGVTEGSTIPMHYDPMIGKLIAYGEDRAQALSHLTEAVAAFSIEGIDHNLLFLEHLLREPKVIAADMHTRMLDEMYMGNDQFWQPEGSDTIAAYAGLCGLALLCDPWVGHTIFHQNDLQSGASLVAFVAVEDGWQEYPLSVVEAGTSPIVSFAEGRQWQFHQGGVGGVAVVQDLDDGTQHTVRLSRSEGNAMYAVQWRGQRMSALIRPERLAAMQRHMPVPTDGSDVPNLTLVMAGVLLRLLVSSGEQVKQGQPLAVVEAMKMENMLVAPRNTGIGDIEANEGDTLPAGAVLMHFAD